MIGDDGRDSNAPWSDHIRADTGDVVPPLAGSRHVRARQTVRFDRYRQWTFRVVNALGARIRLVKGAYKESPRIAYRKKADVDAAFIRLARLLMDEGTYPAFGTHVPATWRH